MAETFKMLAKTLEGLEGVLAQELKDLGAENIVEGRRSVSFEGDLKLMYEANYWLRTAISILKPIASFKAENEQALYDGIYAIKWFEYFDLGQTFAIDTVLVNSNIDHSQFASYKTKDAIADQFTYYFNQRPNVDTKFADIRISVYISNNECEVSLNSSGIPLFKRGYRQGGHKAPINEVLAAGMIKLSGWDMNSHFIDPMCGSGTLLVEAALMAYNFPPMFLREEFSFMNWTNYDPTIWRDLMNEVLEKQRDFEYRIIGGDISSKNLRYARDIVKEIKFHKDIELVNVDIANHIPPQDDVKGVVMMNPPYGERLLSDDLLDLYKTIGDSFKQNFTGYMGWVISSDMTALKSIGLKTSKKIPMFNGALECRFNAYDLYEGSKKVKPENDDENEEESLIASVDVVIDYEALAKQKEENVENIEEVADAEAENDDIFDLYISNKKDEDEAVGDRRGNGDNDDFDKSKYRGRRDGERRGAFGNRSEFDKKENRESRYSKGGDNRGSFNRRDDNKGEDRRNYKAGDKPYEGDRLANRAREKFKHRDDDRGDRRRDSRGGDRPYRNDKRDGGEKREYKRHDDDRGDNKRDSRGGDRPYRNDKRDGSERGKFKRRDDERRDSKRDSRGGDRPYRNDKRDGGEKREYKRRDDDRGDNKRDSRGGDRPYRNDKRDGGEKREYKRRDDDKGSSFKRNRDGDRPYEGDRLAKRERGDYKRRDDDKRDNRGDSRNGNRPYKGNSRNENDRGSYKRRDDDKRGGRDRKDSNKRDDRK